MHNKSSQIAFELWKTIGNEPQNDLKMHRKMATTLFAGKIFQQLHSIALHLWEKSKQNK